MPTKKLPSKTSDSGSEAMSEDQDLWSRQFLKHFEFDLLDAVALLSDKATLEEYQAATLIAVIETLRESGMGIAEFPELAAKAIAAVQNTHSPDVTAQWSPPMNDRRIELIDRQIQETIMVAEQIELAQLTEAMRTVVDSEANLPMAGARALHRKLLSIRQDETSD